MKWKCSLLFVLCSPFIVHAEHSVARQWNDALIAAVKADFARETVQARNLFHISVAMYDAWAVYDDTAMPYAIAKKADDFVIDPCEVKAMREEAMSYAAYRLLTYRFKNSPEAEQSQAQFDALMAELGYDTSVTTIRYQRSWPAALGNYIAQTIIDFGFHDGSNEPNNYANRYYQPVNPPLVLATTGPPDVVDFNRWQPLTFDVFIDKAGNTPPGNTPPFLSPEWGQVAAFALPYSDLNIYERDGYEYWVFHDPGDPPYNSDIEGDEMAAEYKWGFGLLVIWSSKLDASDGVLWDISPASIGNIPALPDTLQEYHDFYNVFEGGDTSIGYDVNPRTGQPYEPQIVPRGDYARVLAEFADVEIPPVFWFVILNQVNDHPLFEKRFGGQGPILDDLEWDVKAYFIMGGAVHDAAVSAWGIKGWYDYVRPITAIRYMADLGQCTDPNLPRYHPGGIQLVDGYIESVKEGDPLAGFAGENIGKIKLYAWRGHYYITNPATDTAGVGWIIAENWWPFKRPTFVTPPFAGYVSGHSTISRSGAEVMTLLTGDPFFPGGMGEFLCKKNEFLVFEDGPSVDVTLQWATYRDAADQISLARLWGGIHPPADDIPGRKVGMKVGPDAFHQAERYFTGQID